MKRTNQFDVCPRSEKEREVFVRWLDASASLWNETNYARRQAFLEDDESVWDADTGSLEGKYKGVLSSSVAQQLIRKNSEAWRSFFSSNERYHAGKLDDRPSPPGTGATKATDESYAPTFETTSTPSSSGSVPGSKSRLAPNSKANSG